MVGFSQDEIEDLFDDNGKSNRELGVSIDPLNIFALNIIAVNVEYLITDNFRVFGSIGVWKPKNDPTSYFSNRESVFINNSSSISWVDVEFGDNFKPMFQLGVHYIKPFYLLDTKCGFIYGALYRNKRRDYVPNISFPYKSRTIQSGVVYIGWQFLRSRLIEINYTFGAGPEFFTMKKSTTFPSRDLRVQKSAEFEASLKIMYKF
jgi:hypothetical protein